MHYRRRDSPTPKRKLPVETGHSKREVWEEAKRMDGEGKLPGVADMIKTISEEFGVSAIEIKNDQCDMAWVKNDE